MSEPKNQVPTGLPPQPTASGGSSGETVAYSRVPNANEGISGANMDWMDGNQHVQAGLGRVISPTYDLDSPPSSVPTSNSNPVHKQENVQAVSLD